MAKQPAKIKYVVAGTGSFPIDMLRYDRATPFSERDAGVIERSFRREARLRGARVTVLAERLTEERWASFGWRAVENTIEKIHA